MNILTVDVGGTAVKFRLSTNETVHRFLSGPGMTPRRMVETVQQTLDGGQWDAISIGYPGEVRDGRASREPHNLAPGWVGFDFRAAFGRPVRLVNDAAMQAIGSYEGGRMLFLGLGTGLGSAMVIYGAVQALELTCLPYRDGLCIGDFLGQRGLDRLGTDAWRKEVLTAVPLLRDAMVADYVILGGGNVRLLNALPPHTRPGHNTNAFEGGFRLWHDPEIRI